MVEAVEERDEERGKYRVDPMALLKPLYITRRQTRHSQVDERIIAIASKFHGNVAHDE